MLRLLLIIILLLVIYWAARSLWRDFKNLRPKTSSKKAPSSSLPAVTDKLVRDPVCGVYCAKKEAYTVIWKGKVYYFCSEECRQKFLASKGSAASSVG